MNKATIAKRWEKGTISLAMMKVYVRKGIITAEDFKEITGIDY